MNPEKITKHAVDRWKMQNVKRCSASAKPNAQESQSNGRTGVTIFTHVLAGQNMSFLAMKNHDADYP